MKIVKCKLQNLILDCGPKMQEHWQMMYRGNQPSYSPITSVYQWSSGNFAEFFTYFNAFALKKWRKYAHVDNVYLQLRCQGDFRIRLFGHFRLNGEISKEMYEEQTFHLPELTEIQLPIPEDSLAEVLGFQFDVLSSNPAEASVPPFLRIESGGWYANVDAELIRDMRIAISMTTFQKEDYVRRNVDALERELFYSGESAASHFRLYIVDNGRSLNPEEYESEWIRLIPNDNVGGAGGFTRGMLAAIDDKEFRPTHVLLIDDDVTVLSEAFVRTFTFLSLLKPEYSRRFLSGAMLYYERMNVQHEDVGYVHEDGSYGPNKPEMDMNLWNHVFENEEILHCQPNSYAGWWYCCIPMTEIRENPLPIPVFIRGDDVEFSLTRKAEFLTLGGICIWHKGFVNKFNANLELYLVHRNSLILQAMSGVCPEIDFVERIDGFFRSNLCRLAYNNCELLLDALEEFCQGPDFLYQPNGEQIMKSHAAKNEKMLPARDVWDGPIDFGSVYRREERVLTPEETRIYEETWNGQTLPDFMLKEGTTAIIAYDWFDDPPKQYLAERILAVNPFEHTVCLRERDPERFKGLLERREAVMADYEERREEIDKQWRAAAVTLQSEPFWREYLGMQG